MRSVFLICRKELNSYFASPIAYLLMAFFALIFGFVLFNATRDFIRYSFQMQFQGGGGPMSINDQIIAGGVTFFVVLLLWLLSWSTANDTGVLSQVLNYLSIVTHFDNFAKGVVETKDLVFYFSMIFFSLFITSRAMESLRWRA